MDHYVGHFEGPGNSTCPCPKAASVNVQHAEEVRHVVNRDVVTEDPLSAVKGLTVGASINSNSMVPCSYLATHDICSRLKHAYSVPKPTRNSELVAC